MNNLQFNLNLQFKPYLSNHQPSTLIIFLFRLGSFEGFNTDAFIFVHCRYSVQRCRRWRFLWRCRIGIVDSLVFLLLFERKTCFFKCFVFDRYQTAIYQPFFREHGHLDTRRKEPFLQVRSYRTVREKK